VRRRSDSPVNIGYHSAVILEPPQSLLTPSTAERPTLRQFLSAGLQRVGLIRPVFRAYEAALAARLRLRDRNDLSQLAPDGLPIPPAKLIVLVGGDTSVDAFLDGGQRIAQAMRDTLARNGLKIEEMQAVLDFGCGCGRITRAWQALEHTQTHGTDYNPELIAWCRQHLPFAHFETNPLAPPTVFGDDYFDFVYAFSVFTHIPEPLQRAWIAELARTLKPGGHLLISTHSSEHHIREISPAEQQRFHEGHLVVRHAEVAGTNLCAVYHSERYVREKLAGGLTVVDFVPGATTQDFFLLRKPFAVSG
jgi:2-polyprenyl-3-methyl-5-hydroxy-6-metoxy-1,4-benzoquinol methylase